MQHTLARFTCETSYVHCLNATVAPGTTGQLRSTLDFLRSNENPAEPHSAIAMRSFAPACTNTLAQCLRNTAPTSRAVADALDKNPRQTYEALHEQMPVYDRTWLGDGEAGVWPLDSALPRTRTRQPHETAPCIHVFSFDRPLSLQRLLTRLQALDYGSGSSWKSAGKGRVALTITIDAPNPRVLAKRSAQQRATTYSLVNRSVAIAQAFARVFQGGTVDVRVRKEHAGLVGQWLGSWTPDLDPTDEHEACILLEDDLIPSRIAYRWVVGALKAYRHQPLLKQLVGSLALNTAEHIHVNADSNTGKLPIDTAGKPLLYRLASSWGFVALRSQWICFRQWYHAQRTIGRPLSLEHDGWKMRFVSWQALKPRGKMWTGFFLQYMYDKNLFTLYANPELAMPKQPTAPKATSGKLSFIGKLGASARATPARAAYTAWPLSARPAEEPPLDMSELGKLAKHRPRTLSAERERQAQSAKVQSPLKQSRAKQQPRPVPAAKERGRRLLSSGPGSFARSRTSLGQVRIGCIPPPKRAQPAVPDFNISDEPCYAYSHGRPMRLTLMANMRETGENYGQSSSTGKPTYEVLEDESPSVERFPPLETLPLLDWDAKPLALSKVLGESPPGARSKAGKGGPAGGGAICDAASTATELSTAYSSLLDGQAFWAAQRTYARLKDALDERDRRIKGVAAPGGWSRRPDAASKSTWLGARSRTTPAISSAPSASPFARHLAWMTPFVGVVLLVPAVCLFCVCSGNSCCPEDE